MASSTVRHDLLQYETMSVSRIIPAAQVVIPPQSTDFPKGWKQWTDRDDRLNDIEEEEEKEVQKAAHADPLEHNRTHAPPPNLAGQSKQRQLDPFHARLPLDQSTGTGPRRSLGSGPASH